MRSFARIIFLLSVSICSQVWAQDIFDCARKGNTKQMEALIKVRPDTVNAVNEAGYSALIIAVYRSQNDAAQFLLDHGANLDFVSDEGTALMAACFQGNAAMAALLITKGAKVNLCNAIGTTALMMAVQAQNHELAKLLLKNGADKTIKDKGGRSALDFARNSGNAELMKLLEENK